MLRIYAIFFLVVLSVIQPGFAADKSSNNKNALRHKFGDIQSKLADTPFGVPIFIETFFLGIRIFFGLGHRYSRVFEIDTHLAFY